MNDPAESAPESKGGSWAMVHVWFLELEHEGSPLTGGDLRTYIALRSYADRNGDCYPKLKTVAARARTSLASVKRAVAKFADLNLIEITHQYRDDGSLRSSRYHMVDVCPVERDQQEEDDWRVADKALFVKILGPYVTSIGGRYREGRFTSAVFYEEFRTRAARKGKGTHFRWPGRFILSLDDKGMDRWLEEECIEIG